MIMCTGLCKLLRLFVLLCQLHVSLPVPRYPLPVSLCYLSRDFSWNAEHYAAVRYGLALRNHRPCTYYAPVSHFRPFKYYRAHSYDAVVSYRAPMYQRQMAYRHVVTDYRGELVRGSVHYSVVLHARVAAYAYVVHVAAQHDAWPYARIAADCYVSYYLRAYGDVGIPVYPWLLSLEFG